MTNEHRTIYVDTVTLLSPNTEIVEVRGYLDTEHTNHWLVYKFSDETIRIPAHQVQMVLTTEEYDDDESM